MRLFVAADLSPEAVAAAGDVIDRLRTRTHDVAPRAKVTWSAPERLHVTVRFIGQIPDDKVDDIRNALQPALPIHRFQIMLSGVGAFPAKGPPRVIWAGITAGTDGLNEVERHVSDRLAAVGVERETRPYTPHLTLGRVRDATGLRKAALLEGIGNARVGPVLIDTITLYESRLSPRGARYLPLQKTDFAVLETQQPPRIDRLS
jgi:2'-5' RNA ligase